MLIHPDDMTPALIPRFVFELDDYNNDNSYKDRFVQTMKTFDQTDLGVMVFVCGEDNDEITLYDPQPIKNLVLIVEELFELLTSKYFNDFVNHESYASSLCSSPPPI